MTRKIVLPLLLIAAAVALLVMARVPARHAVAPSAPAINSSNTSCSPVVNPAPGAQDAAANGALTIFKVLATPSSGYLGFQSAQEVAQAKLEAPAPIYFVGLTDLAQYYHGDDPRALLLGGAEVIYPLSANGNVRSSFRMRLDSCGNWKPTMFSSYPAAQFAATRAGVMQARKLTADQMFMLEIPALHKTFIAYSWQSELTLVPLEDDAAVNLKAGTPIAARDAYISLRPEVKRALQNSGAPGGAAPQPAPSAKP